MADPRPPHPLRRALPLFLLAGFCLSTLDMTAKYLVRDHSLFLVVWARYVGQMIVVTPLAWHTAGPSFFRTRNLRMQLIRSGCLLAATALFFGALRYLPLAEGSAINFLAPMFAVVLATPILGERATRGRIIASITGFLGILILLRPGSSIFHPAAGLLIIGALCNALYQVLTRKLPGDSVWTTLFYSALAGSIGLTALLPFGFIDEDISLRSALIIAMLGVLAGLGHLLLISAFLQAPASQLVPFTYLQMIWATFYSWIVFEHLPDGVSAIGMSVIVLSGVLLAIHERPRKLG